MDASQAISLPSGWSVDTLKEAITNLLAEREIHINATHAAIEKLIDERDRYYALQVKAMEKLVDERDRLYDSRFKAAEVAVSAALAAQEKAVNAAFTASEKAVLKAEQAQKEYNERSNEFRGQLDDQAKTLMPRPETLTMFKAIEEKVAGVANVADSKMVNIQTNGKAELEAARKAFEKNLEAVEAALGALRDYKSEGGGRDLARQTYVEERRSNTALIVSVVFGVLAFGVAVAAFFKHP